MVLTDSRLQQAKTMAALSNRILPLEREWRAQLQSLQKAADGWHLLHDGYEIGDEHAYSEDKFSVLLTKLDLVLAGDRTFHAGAEPVASVCVTAPLAPAPPSVELVGVVARS